MSMTTALLRRLGFRRPRRLRDRLLRHHGPLLVLSLVVTGAFFRWHPSDDPIFLTSIGTGYAALLLAAATLLVGPWHVVTHRRIATSIDLRRDLGIWTGILGLVHTGVGLNVHLRGRPWLYYVPQDWEGLPIRTNLFGWANYTGTVATLLLILLLALSNDRSMQALGSDRWKFLQRWNYLLFALIAVHGVLYQLVEHRGAGLIAVFAVLVLGTAGAQVLGYARRRRGRYPFDR